MAGRALAALALTAGVAVYAAAPARAAWPACVERSTPIRTGLTELRRAADGRLVTLDLRSRAMGRQKVDVLLPRSYDGSGRTRYPVLYLLHGAGSARDSWVRDYPLRELLGRRRVIAVMPEGSDVDATGKRRNGGYSDWFGLETGARGRPPAWESFHVRELVPFIDRRFPTVAGPAGRAVAGISMGGGGAMKYAAAFPGTFGYAASLSGSLDPWIDRRDPSCKAGDPEKHEVVWLDNSPTALAGNLRGVRLFVRSGDGTPGPFDPPFAPADPLDALVWRTRLVTEGGAHVMAERFVAALRAERVGGLDLEYYHGSHSRPYWSLELGELVRWLGAQLRDPPGMRRAFAVESARERFSAWGWSFVARRSVREFVRVRVDHGRLTLRGRGRLEVLTPATYEPRRGVRVRVGRRARRVRADRSGRLRFTVSLAKGSVSVRLPGTG
jgi:diacylglycerol O-acyltransferase / trehalose O-mycolyltransferase